MGFQGACPLAIGDPIHQYHLHIPLDVQMMEKDTYMTVDRQVSSIESGFRIEDMPFNEECRKRVKDVLAKNISATDAIAELNKKYSVLAQKMEDQENVLSDSEGT